VEGAQDESLDEDGSILNMPTDLPPALVQAILPVTRNLSLSRNHQEERRPSSALMRIRQPRGCMIYD
jgi:hypothetical protein